MNNLVKKDFDFDAPDLDVEFDADDNQMNIHFGDVDNNLIEEYHKKIVEALKLKRVCGDVTILTTQGQTHSLLSVLIQFTDDAEEYFLNIGYL